LREEKSSSTVNLSLSQGGKNRGGTKKSPNPKKCLLRLFRPKGSEKKNERLPFSTLLEEKAQKQ